MNPWTRRKTPEIIAACRANLRAKKSEVTSGNQTLGSQLGIRLTIPEEDRQRLENDARDALDALRGMSSIHFSSMDDPRSLSRELTGTLRIPEAMINGRHIEPQTIRARAEISNQTIHSDRSSYVTDQMRLVIERRLLERQELMLREMLLQPLNIPILPNMIHMA